MNTPSSRAKHLYKGKVIPELNWLRSTPWRRITELRYSSTILNVGSRWRWVVGFTPRPLYPTGDSSRYPLCGRLNGPQSRSGRYGEEEKSLAPTDNRTWTPRSSSPSCSRYTDWAIPVPSLYPPRKKYWLKLLCLVLWDEMKTHTHWPSWEASSCSGMSAFHLCLVLPKGLFRFSY
jgi:hypothetical protein